jgi:hypothetical protein
LGLAALYACADRVRTMIKTIKEWVPALAFYSLGFIAPGVVIAMTSR